MIGCAAKALIILAGQAAHIESATNFADILLQVVQVGDAGGADIGG